PPARRAVVLAEQVAAAGIVVGEVVLHHRVGHAAVQIEAAAVQAGAPVVVRYAVLDGETAAIPAPDADRAVALARHVPAVAARHAVLDDRPVQPADDDAVAAVVGEVLRVAGVVVG